jgi:hypothetical protein
MWYLIAAAAGVLLYTLFIAFALPLNRFPPSVGWILCSAGIFFVYYGFARIVHTQFPNLVHRYLNAVGQNVLLYLLLSNLILFTSYALGLNGKLNIAETLIFYIILMLFILFMQFIVVDLNRTNQSMDREDQQLPNL